ncbi:glycine-rich domain-containing protein [Nonomuraea sp. NPDC047897]|uniref:glycine-rich domain-containing protein n=1 Tax=Nonomuraea sp. NPDC047897 TaxID=3364346 RepID=UPI00371F9CDD
MVTTTANQPAEADVIDPRELVTPDLYGRLVARIVAEHCMPEQLADRIMSQALAFLAVCAFNPGSSLAPSRAVDIGWHTFLLDSREYAAFCENVAGVFLHHLPDDAGPGDSAEAAERLGVTIDAMRAAGLPVDAELWLANGKCSQCYAGCTSDPRAV